jgi:hypothetical protein
MPTPQPRIARPARDLDRVVEIHRRSPCGDAERQRVHQLKIVRMTKNERAIGAPQAGPSPETGQ